MSSRLRRLIPSWLGLTWPSTPLAAAATLCLLTACGFTPMYGGDPGATVAQKLDEVDVQNIPERAGQMLRESLQQQLHAAGAPTTQLYSLTVNYGVSSTGIGIENDSAATRNRTIASATWTLAPIGSPLTPLAKGQASTEDAANVIDQQYFALTLETDTINQQLADQIAQQIDTQVAAYFKTHPGA